MKSKNNLHGGKTKTKHAKKIAEMICFFITIEQIRQFENHLIQENIQTEMQLMEAAGHAAFITTSKPLAGCP